MAGPCALQGWDLIVGADRFPDPDIPACLDDTYAGKPVTVALAYGEPGIHSHLCQLISHFDPLRAVPGTIHGDLGHDSLELAPVARDGVGAHRVRYGTSVLRTARWDFLGEQCS
ncbi:hypothetical protein [Streptomyces sp. MBT53]|uniref:hypothetical protein n=1 Tax=Streptomyces sp. MBT53 TaxID=1488384 RepID=UPI0019116104|nr:hypothetical protein [Streptomyces sp. MBT53]MBK6013551.1 hypothetical protein [Streptomyces sp. MBT53]